MSGLNKQKAKPEAEQLDAAGLARRNFLRTARNAAGVVGAASVLGAGAVLGGKAEAQEKTPEQRWQNIDTMGKKVEEMRKNPLLQSLGRLSAADLAEGGQYDLRHTRYAEEIRNKVLQTFTPLTTQAGVLHGNGKDAYESLRDGIELRQSYQALQAAGRPASSDQMAELEQSIRNAEADLEKTETELSALMPQIEQVYGDILKIPQQIEQWKIALREQK